MASENAQHLLNLSYPIPDSIGAFAENNSISIAPVVNLI